MYYRQLFRCVGTNQSRYLKNADPGSILTKMTLNYQLCLTKQYQAEATWGCACYFQFSSGGLLVWRSSKQNWATSEPRLICLKYDICEAHHRRSSLEMCCKTHNAQQLFLGTDVAYSEKKASSAWSNSLSSTASRFMLTVYFMSKPSLPDPYNKLLVLRGKYFL